jgi:protein subunit release factor B
MDNIKQDQKTKTLQVCKDEAAKNFDYNSWESMIQYYKMDTTRTQNFYSSIDARFNEAAELYAQSFKDELAAKQKEIDELKIQLSNYAYERDRAKRDRDTSEAHNANLIEAAKRKDDIIKELELYISEEHLRKPESN